MNVNAENDIIISAAGLAQNFKNSGQKFINMFLTKHHGLTNDFEI